MLPAEREAVAARVRQQGWAELPPRSALIAPHQLDTIRRLLEEDGGAPEWVAAGPGMRSSRSDNSLVFDFASVLRRGGEPLLALVEHPDAIEIAKAALGADEVVVESFAVGDTITGTEYAGESGVLGTQVAWHVDHGAPVSFRTALDPHDPALGNARRPPPLRRRTPFCLPAGRPR